MSEKKEYDFIYDNGDDSGIDYSDLDENEDPKEVIAELKETLGKGPCPKCGEDSMIPDDEGFCYYCLECGYAENQEVYLRGLAGYPVDYVD
jgi:ribosomal protein S27AE